MLNRGDVLQGRYRIVSLLGQGGMGAVYRAWDTRLNIPVALKEMVPQSGLEAATLTGLRHQFQQEATVLARMTHAHLVRVTDFFEEGGNAYLVMDFVEGESLADRIFREGALPEEQVLTWAQQLLDALAYCHNQGVLHRDIKPQNVIIRPDGRIVLVDFGLVKLWNPRDPQTRTIMRGMGTPEYAPPEQYETATGHTDPTSDIYSLGATLYHALTGQAPATATLRMADPVQFMPIRYLAPRVGPESEAVILQAMELVRSKRWQNAQAMAAALKGRAPVAAPAVARPAPSASRWKPPDARPPALPRKRRLPVWAWVLGILGALLVCGALLVFGGLGVIRSQEATRQAVSSATAAAKKTAAARDEATGTAEEATAAAEAVAATATAEAWAAATATAHAQATAAARAQATATAEARLYAPLWEASAWPLILFDDFSAEANGWDTGDFTSSLAVGARSISGGVYRWEAEALDDFVWWAIPDVEPVSDMYLAVDAHLVEGVPDAQYGLILRRVDSSGYYLFLVSDDQHFEFTRRSESGWTSLIDWTRTAAVQPGEVNRLEVVAMGTQFTFYINGQFVGEYSDSQFSSGVLAIVVGLHEVGDTSVVEFDNLELRAP
ncbi:MAG: protein kinase [Anaerolineae bacterium]|nr:protein kinase [Anaerolineae bacterium]